LKFDVEPHHTYRVETTQYLNIIEAVSIALGIIDERTGKLIVEVYGGYSMMPGL
jgi:hypothetical protein